MNRIRRELSQLDADNAAAVPPDVTERVAAALRTAPRPAAHMLTRPKLSRAQWAGLLAGLTAVALAAVVGAHMLSGDPSPAFPAGPTASRITVSTPAFPLTEDELRATLAAPSNLGPLADPRRRASCLAGLGYGPGREALGGRRVEVYGRAGVLILLPGDTAEEVDAVIVEPGCSAADAALLAETSFPR